MYNIVKNRLGEIKNVLSHVSIYPASHYVIPREKLDKSIDDIKKEASKYSSKNEFKKSGFKLIKSGK